MPKIAVTIDGHTHQVDLSPLQPGLLDLTVIVDGEVVKATVPNLDGPDKLEWIIVDGRPYEVVIDTDLHWIKAYTGLHRLEVRDTDLAIARPTSADGRVKAPIPGLVTRVSVDFGDEVTVGQPLLSLEAMKMENEILAPRAGMVSALNVWPGQTVALGEVLVEIT